MIFSVVFAKLTVRTVRPIPRRTFSQHQIDVSRLESALPKSVDSTSLRIRTCEKGGGGGKLLTSFISQLIGAKQEVPEPIDQGVDGRRGEDRPGLAPGPSIEQP